VWTKGEQWVSKSPEKRGRDIWRYWRADKRHIKRQKKYTSYKIFKTCKFFFKIHDIMLLTDFMYQKI